MKPIITALADAFGAIIHPRMLMLVLWPMLAAAGGWLFLGIVFWHAWLAALMGLLQAVVPASWLANSYVSGASHGLLGLFLLMLLVMAVHFTALLITAIFAMPIMVGHVAKRDFPDVEEMKGGSFAGSLKNTAIAVALYLVLLLVSLPFWLIPPLAIILPVLLTAWLNQRLFRYDALAEHATAEELEQMAGHATGPYLTLGVIAGLVQFVPVFNLFLPVYMGLAFTYYCLGALRLEREKYTLH